MFQNERTLACEQTLNTDDPPRELEDLMPSEFRAFLTAARVGLSPARFIADEFLRFQDRLTVDQKRGFLMWCEVAHNTPDIAQRLLKG